MDLWKLERNLLQFFKSIAIKNKLLANKTTRHYITSYQMKKLLTECDIDCSLDTFERTEIMQIFMNVNNIRHELISVHELKNIRRRILYP